MAAGTFYNSHIDYDTLKGGKASGHVGVCKNQRPLRVFHFVPDPPEQTIKRNPKSLQKELETKFENTHAHTHIHNCGEWHDLKK